MGSLVLTSVTTSAASADLTALGSTDWIHWGHGTLAPGLDRKATGGSLISAYTVVGGGSAAAYGNDPKTLSWSDGTPTASASDTTGNYNAAFNTTGAGFSFTMPADTTVRVATLFLGLFKGQGKLVAHLSDSSATDITDTSVTVAGGAGNANYTITYAANSAGQTITFTWTLNTGGDVFSNVTVCGATLAPGAVNTDPPFILSQPSRRHFAPDVRLI